MRHDQGTLGLPRLPLAPPSGCCRSRRLPGRPRHTCEGCQLHLGGPVLGAVALPAVALPAVAPCSSQNREGGRSMEGGEEYGRGEGTITDFVPVRSLVLLLSWLVTHIWVWQYVAQCSTVQHSVPPYVLLCAPICTALCPHMYCSVPPSGPHTTHTMWDCQCCHSLVSRYQAACHDTDVRWGPQHRHHA